MHGAQVMSTATQRRSTLTDPTSCPKVHPAAQAPRTRKRSGDASFLLAASDWDAPLLQYDALADTIDKLTDGETLKGVVMCKAAQAKTAFSLPLAVMSKDGPNTVPGKVDGRRCFRRGTIHEIASKGAQPPQVHGRAKAIAVPKTKSTIMLVRVPRIFADSLWKSWSKDLPEE